MHVMLLCGRPLAQAALGNAQWRDTVGQARELEPMMAENFASSIEQVAARVVASGR